MSQVWNLTLLMLAFLLFLALLLWLAFLMISWVHAVAAILFAAACSAVTGILAYLLLTVLPLLDTYCWWYPCCFTGKLAVADIHVLAGSSTNADMPLVPILQFAGTSSLVWVPAVVSRSLIYEPLGVYWNTRKII